MTNYPENLFAIFSEKAAKKAANNFVNYKIISIFVL